MNITAIENQKKDRKGDRKRFNIYIDGDFSFALYVDTILKFDIHVNKVLDEKQIENIKEHDEYEYAKRSAFDFLSYRIRSESEIRKKLRSKRISLQTVDKVISLLKSLNMINDEAFSKQLVIDKINRKPLGKRNIRQKLFEKGIDKETSEKVIEEFYNEHDEYSLAELSLSKYLSKLKTDDYMIRRKKCFDHLIRKGFDMDVVNDLLNKTIR